MIKRTRNLFLTILVVLGSFMDSEAQTTFTSGSIPMCDTSYFTSNVCCYGTITPSWQQGGFALNTLGIDITSNHPQTLKILLTSPSGTTLLLSAFNGTGGSNYTNCTFTNNQWTVDPSITTGNAPFTGNWTPQGGSLSAFDYQSADGIWTITVIDTLCQGGSTSGGIPYSDGTFNGSAAGGGFGFGYTPVPCFGFIPSGQATICQGETFDLYNFYNTSSPWYTYYFDLNGVYVVNPSAIAVAGTYWIQGSNWNCTYLAQFTLTVNPKPSLGADQIISQCNTLPQDLNSLFTLSGLTTAWSLNGIAITTAATSAATLPGIYQLIATNLNGCVDTALVTLNNTPINFLGSDQSKNICTNENLNLTSLYNTAGYSTNWTLNGNPIANPILISTPGIYELIATASSGCEDTAQIVVTNLPTPSLGADQITTICSGNRIDLTSFFNLIGLNSTWTKSGIAISNPTSINVGGTYTLIATTASGCADTADVNLSVLLVPTLGTDKLIGICDNTSLDLTSQYITTGYTSSWTTNGNPVVNPSTISTAGTYILIASTSSGCTDTAQVVLNMLTTPVLGSNQNTSICSNNTIDLSNLFNLIGLNSMWTKSGIAISNPTSINVGGTYTLIATTASGCADTADVNLSVLLAPTLGTDKLIGICDNTSLDLTSQYITTGYTSSWTTNGNPVVNPSTISTAGTYILIASTSSGCTDTAQVVVNNLATPSLGLSQNASTCANITFDLTSFFNLTNLTSTWTLAGTAISNPTTVNTTGMYTLIASASSGCTDTADINLSVFSTPNLGIDQSQNICSNIDLNLTTFYNTSGNTTSWTLNNNPVVNPISVTSSGTYILIATASSGCTDTAQVFVNNLITPSLGPNQNTSICNGKSTDLTNFFNLSGLTSLWTFYGTTINNPSSVIAAGTYSLVATSTSGCTDTVDVIVSMNLSPTLGVDQQISICDGNKIDLNSLYNTTGNSVSWSNNGASIINSASTFLAGNYQIIVSNIAGCTSSAMVTLSLNPKPNLGLDQIVNLCDGNSTDLTGLFLLASLSSTWTENNNPIVNPNAINVAGIYQVIVTNSFGCLDTASATINTIQPYSLGANQSYTLCQWMNLNLSNLYNTNGLSTTYTFNNIPLINYSTVHDSGTYTVHIIDVNGCTNQALVIVKNLECVCAADFKYTGKCIQDPVSFELLADSSIIGAIWDFHNPAIPNQEIINPFVKLYSKENVHVTLEAKLSCGTVIVNKEIRMEDCSDSCHYYFPSAFSPNGDGLNDNFTSYGECEPEQYLVKIYNVIGQIVFSTNNPHSFWDGKFDNNELPPDVYVIHIEYKLPYQEKQILNQKITLLR